MEILVGLFFLFIIYQVIKGLSPPKKEPRRPEVRISIEVSDSNGYRHVSESDGRPKGKPAKWYGKGENISVKGYDVSEGLIYVGESLPDSYGYGNDACLINPKRNVSPSEPWVAGDEMGYWPQYDSISAKCRGAYLNWLAGGRSEPEANIGYVFLFFYGLERRLFVDGQQAGMSEVERSEIVEEVRRLLDIYGDSGSFRGYASNFLAMEWVLYQSDKPIPDYIDFNDRYCSEPFQVALAQYVVAGKPIPADVARHWMVLHPEFSLRTPARRCAKEFQMLFAQRYRQQFGDGLVIKPNKTPIRIDYRAASPSLRGDLQLKIPELPNPFILKGPLKKLNALVEECTVALESYSRYLGRKDNDPNSLAALALLPRELMIQSPGAEKMKASLAKVCADGPGLIPVEVLYGILGGVAPYPIGKKESENLAALVEGMGFGLTPDVRFHNIKLASDGKVVISQEGHGVDFKPSKEFRMMITILRLGAMVSQIDQDLSPHEEEMLRRLILDNRELTTIEKDSLVALLYWSLWTPQKMVGLKKTLAEVSTSEKTAISQILISVAHADGRIDPREVKELEKLYTTLGLDKKQVTSDIHALSTGSEPVTVSLRDPESSFAIPKRVEDVADTKGFRLDEALIRIREEETRQVKGVLEDIFVDLEEEVEDVVSTSVEAGSDNNPLAELDEAHQNLFNHLLSQETWERKALHDICKGMGLMIDGALEILNEWAYDKVNAPLLDDGEPIYVDVNLAKEILDA